MIPKVLAAAELALDNRIEKHFDAINQLSEDFDQLRDRYCAHRGGHIWESWRFITYHEIPKACSWRCDCARCGISKLLQLPPGQHPLGTM